MHAQDQIKYSYAMAAPIKINYAVVIDQTDSEDIGEPLSCTQGF